MLMQIIKAGTGLVVSTGVGTIVGNAIQATTPSSMKIVTKICVAAGSLVLTGLASDMATKYVESKIDSVTDIVAEAKDKVKQKKDSDEVVDVEFVEETEA